MCNLNTVLALTLLVLTLSYVPTASADAVYSEFELFLISPSSSSWPNTTSASISDSALWQSLCDATNVPNIIVNMTKVFDTVIFGAFSTNPLWLNASSVAESIVSQFNAKNSNNVDVVGWKNQYKVKGASYGYVPVTVPGYLRTSDEPDQIIFAILGAIAAVCVVTQFLYGYFHFQGFGFITRTDDERD